MAEADFTLERVRDLLVYVPETGQFHRRTTGAVAASRTGRGYLSVWCDGKRVRAHRLAWFYVHGEWPRGEVDHINGERSDNRIANLRDVSARTNRENQRRPRSDNASSGLLGVSWCSYHRKWKASIRVDKRLKHIGYFATAEAGHLAYIDAKRRLHPGCTI